MLNNSRAIPQLLALLIAIGTLAGVIAAAKRFHVESHNRRIEIGVEYAEVNTLAQSGGRSLTDILRDMKAQGMTALIVTEDTPANLEALGALRIERRKAADGPFTHVEVDAPDTLERLRAALIRHNLAVQSSPVDAAGSTRFSLQQIDDDATGSSQSPIANAGAFGRTLSRRLPSREGSPPGFSVPVDYPHLRSLGLGLPPDAVSIAQGAGLQIVGRVANFPGVTPDSARAVLQGLRQQGASLVIFVGDEVLGYRGQEKSVADLLQPGPSGTGLVYGDVEFGKQKGAPVLTHLLHGEYVRVHSIQIAEMGQMDENAMVDRYALAARERNIRFLYVRLLTQAGRDATQQNAQFLKKIRKRIEHGGLLTAGGLSFGPARLYTSPGVPMLLFVLMGLGVAAGLVWMLRELAPIPEILQAGLLGVLAVICASLAMSQSGRAVLALLAGIAFPAAACLRAYPRQDAPLSAPLSPTGALARAARTLGAASAVTLIGVLHVIGLLAALEYLVKVNQFLGIKVQHGVPILLIAFAALVGGVGIPGETWARYRKRVVSSIQKVLEEPARYGMLLLGVVALSALVLILARTGNDSGVSVSAAEMKVRALLDRILPVRPRTKEFLVGHPAFLLALAWWHRGRRRWAIPCFVVGSIGQVSLLNTFCHIHTPLIASAWRGGLGLLVGALLGGFLFIVLEQILPPPDRTAPALPDERFRDL